MVRVKQMGLERDESLRLILLKISRNVWIPWRHILKGVEYLVARVSGAGMEMNAENLTRNRGVRAVHVSRSEGIRGFLGATFWQASDI